MTPPEPATGPMVDPMYQRIKSFVIPSPTNLSYGDVSLALGDFDGDKDIDVAFFRPINGRQNFELFVLYAEANGTFGNFQQVSAPLLPEFGALRIVSGDFNDDNLKDLAIYGDKNDAVIIKSSQGMPLARFDSLPLASKDGLFLSPLVVGDFSGDGIDDLAGGTRKTANGTIGPAATGTLSVALATKRGTFGALSNFNVSKAFSSFMQIYDIDGDGRKDIVSLGDKANSSGTSLLLATGDGRGGFASRSFSVCDERVTSGMDVGDINGDGATEILFSCGIRGGFIIVSVAANPKADEISIEKISLSAWSLKLARLNDDTLLDLATTEGTTLSLTLSTPAGNFRLLKKTEFERRPTIHEAVDLDGDKLSDLIISHISSSGQAVVSIVYSRSAL